MTDAFKRIMLNFILPDEGGYVNHPKDPGGETNMGITKATYERFKKLHPHREFPTLRNLPKDMALEIYWEFFAKPIRFDQLPAGVNYALLDFAVNSGVSRAVKTLQAGMKGVSVDGILGLQTLSAIKAHNAKTLVTNLCEDRQAFVERLKTFKTFGKGWTRRIAGVKKHALQLIEYPTREPIIEEPRFVDGVVSGSEKAEGQFTAIGAIKDSRKAQGGLIALIGGLISAIPEAVELVKPATDLFAGGSFAPIIGNILTILGALYIVHIKQKEAV